MIFDYEALKAAGFKTVVISYSGSNDEGWINEIQVDPPLPEGTEISSHLYETLERQAMDVLEDNYGGWEINEGSEGHITLFVAESRCKINHGERYEQVRWGEQEIVG